MKTKKCEECGRKTGNYYTSKEGVRCRECWEQAIRGYSVDLLDQNPGRGEYRDMIKKKYAKLK